jgi:hypothetical protein
VIGRAHISEERLFTHYVADRSGEVPDPPTADHLIDCSECRGRYDELVRFMDGLRAEAEADVEATFPPEWREAQRDQIMRRLVHVGRAARVISFPGRLVARQMVNTASRMAPRWAAAAAAAGLLVGAAAGMYFDPRSQPPAMTVVRPQPAAQPVSVASEPVALDADQFLSELESALGGPRTPELMPYDVLTPQVREIALK